MSISRRKFIQLSSLASASLMLPNFLKAFESGKMVKGSKKLIVIQLSGGNDGLNTIIPYRNDIYYKSRPLLGINKDAALSLTDEAGINPALKGIKGLYDQGYVTILNSVGYPQPNRSHFRSMDIWQSGSRADDVVTTGWLGRYADLYPGSNEHNTMAIEVDDTLSLAMKGKVSKGIAVQDVDRFHRAAKDPFLNNLSDAHKKEHDDHLASYLYKTLRETESSADYIFDKTKTYTSSIAYPNSALGKRMKIIGTLVNAHADTAVYYVSHGSFDTHVQQQNRQERLFKELDEALVALVADLKAGNTMDDVLIMTFSEFGRRVGQNASQGTDHGTASNMFMIGSALKQKGLYNDMPDLTDLDEGDLKYKIDFKQVYATILGNWLNADDRAVLDKRYDKLGFI